MVITGNSIIYVDQSSRRIALPVNGWASRVSDMQILPADSARKFNLEGSRSVFVDDKNFFIILKDGTVYPIEIVVDGKTVSKLLMSPPLAQTSVPSIVRNIGNDHIFIGSAVGPSVLLKAAHVEEEIEQDQFQVARTAVVKDDDVMDYDIEDEGLRFSVRTYFVILTSYQRYIWSVFGA